MAALAGCSADAEDEPATTTSEPPTSVPLPEGTPEPSSEDAASVLAFLEGEGAPLLEVHEAALRLSTGELDADTCTAVAGELDETAPSGDVAALVTGVADEVLRSALHSERVALGILLTKCVDGDTSSQGELREAAGAVATRLDQVEEAS